MLPVKALPAPGQCDNTTHGGQCVLDCGAGFRGHPRSVCKDGSWGAWSGRCAKTQG